MAKYEYTMVQIPPNLEIKGAQKGSKAAKYLEEIVKKHAEKGWEFWRVDSIGVKEPPGCLNFFSQQPIWIYYVVTFRQEVDT